jgi:hypothetical protein
VTIPEILKQDGYDFTDQKTFIETVRTVPYLKDIISEAEPIADKMLTATNYSMINGRLADYDKRWILVGDASYFVDPLFSSGAGFATTMAVNAAMVLERTLAGDLDDRALRDLWDDYDDGWHNMAETFALAIDQWYHPLGKGNADSIYWSHRGSPDLDIQQRTFDVLINTAVTAHVLQNILDKPVEGIAPAPVRGEGPLSRVVERAGETLVDLDAVLGLAPGVVVREGIGLDVPGFKGFLPVPPFDSEIDEETRATIAKYWADPVANGDAVPSPAAEPVAAYRFSFADGRSDTQIRGLAREGTAQLLEILATGPTMRQLENKLTAIQQHFLRRLMRAGMVTAATA